MPGDPTAAGIFWILVCPGQEQHSLGDTNDPGLPLVTSFVQGKAFHTI